MSEMLERIILEMMNHQKVPGFAIGIIKDNQSVYEKGFGTLELHSNAPVTKESVFQLCSIAKTFVATAVLQLVEAGDIDLDTPVSSYLPYFQTQDRRTNEITVRHLLTHTSGLPGFDMKERFEALKDFHPVHDDEALERYVRDQAAISLASQPGELFRYSDMGFNILGDVIAKTAGQSFESFIQENIFGPLQMVSSTFLLEDVKRDAMAMPHIADELGESMVSKVLPYSREEAPCGFLYSNVVDMLRWARTNLDLGLLHGLRILPASSYDLLWYQHAAMDWGEGGSAYGLGWILGAESGYKVVRHIGGDFGYQAELLLVPEKSLAVVTMGNYLREDMDNWYASILAWEAVKMMLD